MATLIWAFNSEGCIGRCDARCYDALGPDCHCICGGANHGKGLNAAIENTAAQANEFISNYKKANPGQELNFLVNTDCQQLSLLDFIARKAS